VIMKRYLLLLSLACSLSAVAQTSHSVALTCVPPTTGPIPAGYNFYRGTVMGGPYTLQNSTPQATCAFTDVNGLVEGQKYFYVATSETVGGGESVQSNEASALIPFSRPSPPTLNPPVVK
jgi:hypothetical protein